jgi:dienelactone hydrolase
MSDVPRTVRCLTIGLVIGASACGSDATSSTRQDGTPPDTGFVVTGNAESVGGATWTFKDTVAGVDYDLTGVLFKPTGVGPFPAVVLSHGSDGSAAFLASLVAPTMVQWGLVCIGVNYTHAVGVPLGSPGTSSEVGASAANVLRAHMAHELLRRLGYVDMSRVAHHGHSLGAYLGVAAIAAYPADYIVASHTGGGVRPDFIVAGPAPTVAEARLIRIPYQAHHGDADGEVALSYDQRLDSVLTSTQVDHQLVIYPGAGHLDVRSSAQTLSLIHDWYVTHRLITP